MGTKQKSEIENYIRKLLEYIGEDPNRKGLIGTPDRIIRMWKEIFRGYDESQKPKITTFDNDDDGLSTNDMIIDTGDFYSMCEHHIMPFFGRYFFAYIPGSKILGISKVGRVVDYCAAKLQIQERLAGDIVSMMEDALSDGADVKPKGMAIIIEGEHLCKTMRGVKKKGKMLTIVTKGVLDTPEKRMELIQLFKR